MGILLTLFPNPLRSFDNASVVFYSLKKKKKNLEWLKHIEIKYLLVKDKMKQEQRVEDINTEDMIGDSLTKGLMPKLFDEHVYSMDVLISFDLLA